MRIEIESYIRSDEGKPISLSEITSYEGDDRYIRGSISLIIDGNELLGTELLDDINWLWPYLILTTNDALKKGASAGYFPSQPILFSVKQISGTSLMIEVSGPTVSRSAVVDRRILLKELGLSFLFFLEHMERLIEGDHDDYRKISEIAYSWILDLTDSGEA